MPISDLLQKPYHYGVIFVEKKHKKNQNNIRFRNMSLTTLNKNACAHNVCVCARQTVLRADGSSLQLSDMQAIRAAYPDAEMLTEAENALCMMELPDTHHLPEGYQVMELRQFFALHSEEENFYYARARGLLSWRSGMRFCPHCGAALTDSPTLTARECPECKSLHFPKIEPCVIVVIRKGNQILLARHVERNQDIYACIAGFVEDGESLEQALKREIREETGLEVKNIRYFGSQSWPFPFQLMIGFTAEYASGEIHVQKEELQEARWFDIHDLPPHPRPGSISHLLIHSIQEI